MSRSSSNHSYVVPNGDNFCPSSSLMEPLVNNSHSIRNNSMSSYSGPFSLHDTITEEQPTTVSIDTALLPVRLSVWIGILVGFVLESIFLVWHTASTAAADTSAAPTIVVVLLWVLVTVAAPLVTFVHWMEWVERRHRRHHHGDHSDQQPYQRNEVTVTRATATTVVEWWFGLGMVLGVSGACIAWDALLGSNHVSLSVQVAAATAAVGTVALRLYRLWQQRRQADKRCPSSYDAVDPEQLDVVELAPGTLTL
jgi:uncharacterized membrane protein YedE/YeeE